MNFKKIVLLIIVLIVCGFKLQAQNINQQNFSNIRVDELSDDQIRQFLKQVESSGLSESQLEQVALARGMSSTEIKKLRDRIEKLKRDDNKQKKEVDNDRNNRNRNRSDSLRNDTNQKERTAREYNLEDDELRKDSLEMRKEFETEAEKALFQLKSKIFGSDLFKNSKINFEPNLRIATPANYQLGPDDEIAIDIYGYSEVDYKLTVSPEGNITIPGVGLVNVNGLTIEQARQRIRSKLSSIYSGIKSGNTGVNITLGNIRSIKVTLLGEVTRPGTYTLSSLATAFNALYASGGPTENGSFRLIEIVRGNRVLAKLDVYEFLMKGFQTNNVRLQDNDIIRIPPYKTRVEFVGEVKRPGLYEAIASDTFSDLLNYAGGFSDNAYKAKVKVLQNTDKERKIADIFAAQYANYKASTGDKYFVEPILDRFANRVTIEGAVFRPGQFELQEGLTLSQLIKKADGLKEDAFLSRGYITRLKDDLQTELLSFDVGKILNGQAADVTLKREDKILIASIFDLREEYFLRIEGEVIKPGRFDFAENTSLQDLIIKAGGLKESASPQRIEVSRRVKNSDPNSASAITAQVFQINVDKDLSVNASDFKLQPYDIVAVRSSYGYEKQKQVKIDGEVLYPGTYTLTRKDEKISDLIKRAGGITALAYADGAALKRKNKQNEELERDKINRLLKLQRSVKDSLAKDSVVFAQELRRNDYVGIDMKRILKAPGSKYDLLLEDGDALTVPRQLQTVKVSGEVLYPNTSPFAQTKGFKQYVSQAGGFSGRANRKGSYIIYANGSVKANRKFLFFNNYPNVKPGAEIFVPKSPERKGLSTAEVVGLTSAIASLGAIVISVLNLSR